MNCKSTIDGFAQKVHQYRHIKSNYQSEKSRLRQTIHQTELTYALSYLHIDYFKQPVQIISMTPALKKQLLPLFLNKQAMCSLLSKHLSSAHLLSDFTLIFPHQLSLLKELKKYPLKPIYEELLKKRHQTALFGEAVEQAVGILDRYGEVISVDFMGIKEGEGRMEEEGQEKQQPALMKHHSEPRNGEVAGYRRAMYRSMQQGLSTDKIKVINDLEVLDTVINSIIDSLTRNIHCFRIQLRYILSQLKPNQLRQAQLQWVSMLQSRLLQDCCFQVYTVNARIISHILKSLIDKPTLSFASSDLRQLYATWYFKLCQFFRRLLQTSQQFTSLYESPRTLCLLSYNTLSLLPLSPPIQAAPNKFLLFNTVDPVSSLNNPRPPVTRSNFIRIENQPDWVELLRLVTVNKQEMVGVECERISNMVEDVEFSATVMEERGRAYLYFLENRIQTNRKMLSFLQKHQADSKVLQLWNTMTVQPSLSLVVDNTDIYFSTQGKGCNISSLNKYIQYVGLSRVIADRVHNGIQLEKLNSIYCDYMALVRARLLVECGSDAMFSVVREKVEASLFHKQLIGEGPGCKDLVARRGMESQLVLLRDLELGQFSEEENFYVSLVAGEFQRLAHATSPVHIISCFLEMSSKVQSTMKLSRPQAILAGDAQLSIIYFLVSRYRLQNFASLLNFLQVCWFNKADYGQHEYMLTVLKSVLQLLLETRQKSFVEGQEQQKN